jgi:hypothetical protein
MYRQRMILLDRSQGYIRVGLTPQRHEWTATFGPAPTRCANRANYCSQHHLVTTLLQKRKTCSVLELSSATNLIPKCPDCNGHEAG